MLHIKTKTGFEADIDENVRDDWEILEKLAAVSENDIAALVGVPKLILSAKDEKRLRKHCTENGRVLASKMAAEILNIFEAIPDGKK